MVTRLMTRISLPSNGNSGKLAVLRYVRTSKGKEVVLEKEATKVLSRPRAGTRRVLSVGSRGLQELKMSCSLEMSRVPCAKVRLAEPLAQKRGTTKKPKELGLPKMSPRSQVKVGRRTNQMQISNPS